jgi:hypothetical protein
LAVVSRTCWRSASTVVPLTSRSLTRVGGGWMVAPPKNSVLPSIIIGVVRRSNRKLMTVLSGRCQVACSEATFRPLSTVS